MRRVVLLVAMVVAGIIAPVALADRVDPGVRLPVTVVSLKETVVVVQPGDHLWKISRRHLDIDHAGLPTTPYWRRVIHSNQPHLRSGDPNLIYPGEMIRLPPINDSP